MVNFINLRYKKIAQEKEDIIIDRKITIEELSKVVYSSLGKKLIIKSLIDCFNFTDKGGKRLVDFIKSLSNYIGEVDIYYDPGTVNYLLETSPNKLFSYSSINPKNMFQDLLNPTIISFKLSGILIPTKFKNIEELFNWVVIHDSELALNMMNETRNVLINDKFLLKKDLKFFSDQIPSASLIHQKYGFEVDEIVESFDKYLSINFK